MKHYKKTKFNIKAIAWNAFKQSSMPNSSWSINNWIGKKYFSNCVFNSDFPWFDQLYLLHLQREIWSINNTTSVLSNGCICFTFDKQYSTYYIFTDNRRREQLPRETQVLSSVIRTLNRYTKNKEQSRFDKKQVPKKFVYLQKLDTNNAFHFMVQKK